MRSSVVARSVFGVVLGVALAGCGWMSDDKGFIVDRTDDYLKTQERPGLEIPDDLTETTVGEPYAIPPISSEDRSTYAKRAPRPQPIYTNDSSRGVKIQKLGDRRWLVLPEPPAVAWAKIKQFLNENGIDTSFEAAREGRLTSVWLNLDGGRFRDVVRLSIQQGKADAGIFGGRERIEVAVEQGMRAETTEVHLRHDNDELSGPLPEQLTAAELGRSSSDVLEVEEALLRELGAYVASDVSSQVVSMVGRDIVGTTKAQLETGSSGHPELHLNLDFDRAWASVNQALDNAEVEVTNQDRDAGVFFIDLPEKALTGEEDSGFFRGLLGGRTGNVLSLQIRLTPRDEGGFLVRALSEDATPTAPELARDVLNLIKEYAV